MAPNSCLTFNITHAATTVAKTAYDALDNLLMDAAASDRSDDCDVAWGDPEVTHQNTAGSIVVAMTHTLVFLSAGADLVVASRLAGFRLRFVVNLGAVRAAIVAGKLRRHPEVP